MVAATTTVREAVRLNHHNATAEVPEAALSQPAVATLSASQQLQQRRTLEEVYDDTCT